MLEPQASGSTNVSPPPPPQTQTPPPTADPDPVVAPDNTTHNEIEADDLTADSAYGDNSDDDIESTASITSSILRYREENGRTYHAYKDGTYSFPNDDRENDRLDLQHALFTLTLPESKLFVAPIPEEQTLHRVLDVGTGTGIWAMDFADAHRESQVIGVDLSPIQPRFVPPNVAFEIDDLEAEWTFSKPFDFIFGRMTVCAFADPGKFFRQAFDNLVPGGWTECLDICNPIKSDDGTLTEDSELLKWSKLMHQGYQTIGRSAESARSFHTHMEAAGFVNVHTHIYKWPTNRWPKDAKFKEIGMWNLANVEPGIEGISMAIFTRMLGWTKEEVEVFLVNVRKELKNPRIHAYWQIYSVYGQKPPAAAPDEMGTETETNA